MKNHQKWPKTWERNEENLFKICGVDRFFGFKFRLYPTLPLMKRAVLLSEFEMFWIDALSQFKHFYLIWISRSFKKGASDNTISFYDQSIRFSGLWLILARDLGRSGQNNRELRENKYIFLNFEQWLSIHKIDNFLRERGPGDALYNIRKKWPRGSLFWPVQAEVVFLENFKKLLYLWSLETKKCKIMLL